jgi:hypothetical protein
MNTLKVKDLNKVRVLSKLNITDLNLWLKLWHETALQICQGVITEVRNEVFNEISFIIHE